MEALTIGTPTVGLRTAGIGDLVADGLVQAYPTPHHRQTSPARSYRQLKERDMKILTKLPTWESAADSLAQAYLEAIETEPNMVHRVSHVQA